jgi:hypothetical protein
VSQIEVLVPIPWELHGVYFNGFHFRLDFQGVRCGISRILQNSDLNQSWPSCANTPIAVGANTMSQLKRRKAKRAKRQAREHRQLLTEQAERSALQRFLQHIHVWDDVEDCIDLDCLFRRNPSIMVERAQGTPKSAKTDRMLRDIQKAIDRAVFTFPQGYRVPVNLAWSRLLPVLVRLEHLGPDCEEASMICRRIRDTIVPFLEDIHCGLSTTLHAATADIIIAESRIDSVIYFLSLELGKNSVGRTVLRLLLHQQETRQRPVVVDGKRRRAYWVGSQLAFNPVEWIKWSGAQLKTEPAAREYPVLIQEHALRRLFERLGRSFPRNREGMFHSSLGQSLQAPVFHWNQYDKASRLVEFRLQGIKVGYFVARIVDDSVLLQTFLFLTAR